MLFDVDLVDWRFKKTSYKRYEEKKKIREQFEITLTVLMAKGNLAFFPFCKCSKLASVLYETAL